MTHYERQWAKYRSVEKQFWLSLALCLVLFVWRKLTTITMGRVTLHPPSGLDFLNYLAFLWTAANFYRWMFFDCPRCGQSFFVQSSWLDGTIRRQIRENISEGRRCAHCQLPMFGSDPDEQKLTADPADLTDRHR